MLFVGTCSGILISFMRVVLFGVKISVTSVGCTLSMVSVTLTFGFELTEFVSLWDWEPVLRVWFDFVNRVFSVTFDLSDFQL